MRPRILERLTTSSERNQIFRKKSFNWTISTQYTQQYYHLFQTFNMPWRRGFNIPWRRGTARKSRGLPIQISRLIIITYSSNYWHLCFTCLLQKITVVDRHVAPRHLLLLLSQDLNLLDNWESLWHTQGAGQTGPAAAGEGEGATLWEMEERQLHERGTSLPRPKRTYSSCSGTKWMMEQGEENRTRQLRGGRFPRERGQGQVEFQKAVKNS